MEKFESLPKGVQAFAKRLKEKTDTGINLWNCDNCGQEIFIAGPKEVSLHIFVLPADDYPTKGLCMKCIKEEAAKQGVTLPQNPKAPLN